MIYSDFHEHDVSFRQTSYEKILQHTNENGGFTDTCILSYGKDSCNNNVILRILQNKNITKRINANCYQYQPYSKPDDGYSPNNVLNAVRISRCTRVLLLLGLVDLINVFMNLNMSYIREDKVFLTLLKRHYSSKKLIETYDEFFHIINIDADMDENPTNFSRKNIMSDFALLFDSPYESIQ